MMMDYLLSNSRYICINCAFVAIWQNSHQHKYHVSSKYGFFCTISLLIFLSSPFIWCFVTLRFWILGKFDDLRLRIWFTTSIWFSICGLFDSHWRRIFTISCWRKHCVLILATRWSSILPVWWYCSIKSSTKSLIPLNNSTCSITWSNKICNFGPCFKSIFFHNFSKTLTDFLILSISSNVGSKMRSWKNTISAVSKPS